MKQPTISRLSLFMATLFMLGMQLSAFAQDKIEVSKAEVSSWFARNWMWVVTGVVVLLLILIFSRGGSKRRTTTVVKDQFGDVRSVTTTEIKE